jgi:REP element-mobilizing transposase RayT
MSNHFHFLINTTKKSTEVRKAGSLEITALAFGFKTVQSSFAQAINKQQKRTGSLFRQKTKAKPLDRGQTVQNRLTPLAENRLTPLDYPTNVFHYIHQNPLKAGLVNRLEDWPYSSFSDYAKMRNGSLCNQSMAYSLLNINETSFIKDSYSIIDGTQPKD